MIGYTPQSAAARKTLFRQWKVLALGLIGCGLVVFLFMHFTGKDTVPKERKETPTKFEITPNETDVERYKALYDERLHNLEGSLKEASAREKHFTKELERLKEELHKKQAEEIRAPKAVSNYSQDGWPPAEAITGGQAGQIIGKNAPHSNGQGFSSGQTSRQRQAAEQQASQRLPRLVITDLSQKKEPSSVLGKLPQQQSKPSALTYLPSGTFAKARLLNGAIAPTRGQGSGNPVPILMELTDAAVMPNLYRSGIKRCFVTANATGELASERVLVRLDRLSCIDENGGAVDTKLQGYVSGEDGKTGLRARLVTKSGQAIANALFTGTLSGLGKAVSLAAEDSTTSITGTVSKSVKNPWRAGLGEGTSHAMDRITDYYLKLASDMFPVLEVDSGRDVEIVISQGLPIERLNK